MPYPVAAIRNKNFGNPTYIDLVKSFSPLAYWPLNEISGTVAVNLGSLGTGANGAYTGVDLANTAAPGGTLAPLWDGANDYCNIYSATLNTNWSRAESSLSLWLKVSASGVWSDGTLRSAFNIYSTGAAELLSIRKSSVNNKINFTTVTGGTNKSIASTANYSTTAWIHCVLTRSKASDVVRGYINGVADAATATSLGTPGVEVLGATSCNIGATLTTPTQVFSGWIAHVALWNRILTTTEIANLYAWGV